MDEKPIVVFNKDDRRNTIARSLFGKEKAKGVEKTIIEYFEDYAALLEKREDKRAERIAAIYEKLVKGNFKSANPNVIFLDKDDVHRALEKLLLEAALVRSNEETRSTFPLGLAISSIETDFTKSLGTVYSLYGKLMGMDGIVKELENGLLVFEKTSDGYSLKPSFLNNRVDVVKENEDGSLTLYAESPLYITSPSTLAYLSILYTLGVRTIEGKEIKYNVIQEFGDLPQFYESALLSTVLHYINVYPEEGKVLLKGCVEPGFHEKISGGDLVVNITQDLILKGRLRKEENRVKGRKVHLLYKDMPIYDYREKKVLIRDDELWQPSIEEQ